MADESFDLRSWIREQRHVGYATDFADDDHFRLETDFATAQINFYDMAPEPEIVELHIEEKATGEAKFFLHFHAAERDHATKLFREMVQALLDVRERQRVEVLLCCTVGMTTSFFAERLNQVAEAMGLDWSFSAVAANDAYEQGRTKAAVLVAPQIGYQAERMQAAMPEVPVLAVPTAIFAGYDAAACVEWLRDELDERKKSGTERALEHVARDLVNDKRILAIATHAAPEKVAITYRLYDCGEVALEREVIKRTLSIADFTDIVDTQVCTCMGGIKADAVGIALPGAIVERMLDAPMAPAGGTGDEGMRWAAAQEFDVAAYFNQRYDVPVFFCNNSSAAALGWYGSQDAYENVCFHSQAVGWPVGGQGHVVGGRLVEGAHGIAGEIRFIVDILQYAHPLHANAFRPYDTLDIVGRMLAIACAGYDPEVIALRSDLLPDMDEVAGELAKYIPRSRQPKLVHVDNYNECILLGMMMCCLQKLADGETGQDQHWMLDVAR